MVRRRQGNEAGVLKNEINLHHHTLPTAPTSERGTEAHSQDKLNMEHDEDIFKEIMALIDKRNRLCEEWIEYIEHVLREIMDGNNDYRSMLPNHVILPKKDTQPKAA